ncbi:MAG: hypothetical protein HY554_10055, partial [Elusimicrobia bacterium]|nr:hypothetical protein [Elusimicrobiota bacterium]
VGVVLAGLVAVAGRTLRDRAAALRGELLGSTATIIARQLSRDVYEATYLAAPRAGASAPLLVGCIGLADHGGGPVHAVTGAASGTYSLFAYCLDDARQLWHLRDDAAPVGPIPALPPCGTGRWTPLAARPLSVRGDLEPADPKAAFRSPRWSGSVEVALLLGLGPTTTQGALAAPVRLSLRSQAALRAP